jgi:rubrerythrin
MPEFTNPFSGVVPGRKLTASELARALRLGLAAEEEAVHLYEAHADATDNELAQKVLRDIANEERIHVGEFQRLLSLLLKDEDQLLSEGAEEVNEMATEGGSGRNSGPSDGSSPGESRLIPTIGDMK